MRKRYLSFETFRKNALKDPEIKREYDKLQPEFAMIEAVIKARRKKGFTQAQLAKEIGTKQSVISRLEIGNANPTVSFLKKLAGALQSRLEIRFNSL